MKSEKQIIGRREWLSIPELNLGPLRGKVDTGARTSSLHATEIEAFEKENVLWVRFLSVDGKTCEAPLVFTKKVKSSNGEVKERYFIEVTGVTLTGEELNLLLSLSSRDTMKCPLLLGRRALTPFLVDSSQSQLLGKPYPEHDK